MPTKITATQQAQDRFERTLAVLDATITGAVFGGLSPSYFEAILSLWFLRVSWGRCVGKGTEESFEEWSIRSDPNRIWTPVLERVDKYIDDFEGELQDNGDLRLDVDPLLEFLDKKPKKKLSEIQERREYQTAIKTVEWLLNNLMRDNSVPESTLEICLLVVWYKCAVLSWEVAPEDYLLVKQNWLQVQGAYGEIMDQEWSSP